MKLLTAALVLVLSSTCSYGITPKEALRLLRENSLDLKIAKEEVEKSSLKLEETKSGFFPQISLIGSFSENYQNLPKGWNQNYQLGVKVNAEPINFQRFTQLKIDKVGKETSKEAFSEELLNQAYLVLKALYQVAANEKKVRFKRENLKASQEILKAAGKKYKEGLVMITDLLKARSELEKAKGELSQAENDLRQSFNNLNELLDFKLRNHEKVEVNFQTKMPNFKVNKLIKEALNNRPEVKRAKLEVKRSSLQVEFEKRALRPTVDLTLSLTRSGTTFLPKEKFFSGGISLNFPIFDSGLTRVKTVLAGKDREIALLKLKKVENSVKTEVLNTVSQVKSAYATLKSAKSYLDFSYKAYKRVLKEYKLGVSDIVSLMQAFQNLKNAQENYVNSLLNYNLSVLLLRKSTGELLKEVKN